MGAPTGWLDAGRGVACVSGLAPPAVGCQSLTEDLGSSNRASASGAVSPDTAIIVDRSPLPLRRALRALARCVVSTLVLLARRSISQPKAHLGTVLHFGDGSHARIYRETVVPSAQTATPAVLVVAFKLRRVRGWGHALFRAESLLNTPLFVGFPGFVSKLWLAHDGNGVYRGFYEWDRAELADAYVRALWWVLALVSVQESIRYAVVPGLRRDDVLTDPTVLDRAVPDYRDAWWRLTVVEPAGS
jgi:hypothetical protein